MEEELIKKYLEFREKCIEAGIDKVTEILTLFKMFVSTSETRDL